MVLGIVAGPVCGFTAPSDAKAPMPVYRGKPYQADTGLPDGADPEQTFFHLRASGETYTDYEAYLASLRLKQSRVWSCLITGQKGLTYEEAARAELRAGLLVDQVRPRRFSAPIGAVAHRYGMVPLFGPALDPLFLSPRRSSHPNWRSLSCGSRTIARCSWSR